MINFRYHLISVTAIFLALAVGVLLGAGVFSGSLTGGFGSDEDSTAAELRQQVQDDDSLNSFEAGYNKAIAPKLLDSRLKGHSVAIFSVPGASSDDVKGVAADVQKAGGTVTVEAKLTRKLVDPSHRQFAQGVAEQTLDGVKGLPSTEGDSSYELVGTGLARALVAKESGRVDVDGGATTILSAYSESGLISVADKPSIRAKLAIIVTGSHDGEVKEGQGELVSVLASTLDSASTGVVVAGPPSSARGEGAVKAVRDGDTADDVSTVDVVNVPAGRVVTVLALQREASGHTGHYGAANSKDGAMPPLSS